MITDAVIQIAVVYCEDSLGFALPIAVPEWKGEYYTVGIPENAAGFDIGIDDVIIDWDQLFPIMEFPVCYFDSIDAEVSKNPYQMTFQG